MKNIELVPATKQVIEEFTQQPVELTQKSFAVIENGEMIALFGVAIFGTRYLLFSKTKEGIDPNDHKRAVVKAYQKALTLTKGHPVYAWADPSVAGSHSLLKHMGFTHLTGDHFIWLG